MIPKLTSFFSASLLRSMGVLLLLLFMTPVVMAPVNAQAQTAGESTTCAKNLTPTTVTPGKDIVTSVFASINSIINKIGEAMYKNIVGNSKFQNVVAVCMSLYVATYGAMVMMGMAPMVMGAVVGRLLRIAIVYGLLSFGISGWAMFDQYFSQLFMGGMNELIFNFAVAAGVPVLPPAAITGFGVSVAPTLDATAVSALYGPMNVVFQPFYIFAILGMLFLNVVCTLMALALMWAFWDFTMMILGAIYTYVRAIIGMTFLFGIAPIFIIFLLFQPTRALFFGWISQVLGFALAPVLLFAFLSFYTVLLTSVLTGMFANIDFCWGKCESVPGTTTDFSCWRPAMKVSNGIGGYSWVQKNGDWTDTSGNPLPPPISIVSVMLFVMVCHLGKNFCKHIEEIAGKVSGGMTPGIVTGEQAGTFINNKVTGGRGFGAILGSPFKRGTSAPSTAGNTLPRATPTGPKGPPGSPS